MIDQPRRNLWRFTWRAATSDLVIIVLLLGIAAGLAITAGLPQMPEASDDPMAYARWRSKTQARFGSATLPMQTLGLFTVGQSLIFRALLALLAGCLLLRLVDCGDRLRQQQEISEPTGEWQTLADVELRDVLDDVRGRRYRVLSDPPLFQADRWPWAELFPLLVHGGALLFLSGLLISNLWGWQITGLTVQSGERVTLPNSQGWIALDENAAGAAHSPGIVTFLEERGPGVEAAAISDAGAPLALQRTAEADPVTQLSLALTEDQYLAIPEAQFIIGLTPHPDHTVDAHSPILVQVYRSPSGRLMTETTVEGDAELNIDDVTLRLTSRPYATLSVTFNPGRWPTRAGGVLLLIGMLGGAAWPARRFWLREEAQHVEGSGDLLPTLAQRAEV